MIILHKVTPAVSEGELSRFLTRAKQSARLRGPVNVLITSSAELRLLNRRFRGKDRPTDVLSFPPEFPVRDYAGDVAISAEIARDNAKRLGHTIGEELKILVLHGVLHLAGHDHESDKGEMAALEEKLRQKLGLPTGLIQRTTDVLADKAVKRKKKTSRRSIPGRRA